MRLSKASVGAHLLWTGGWDSTYRLLDLVLLRGVRVQPYYVLDTARRSSLVELATMQRIRRSVAALSAAKGDLIEPTAITCIADIAPNADITRRYESLKSRSFLGSQYDWLARYVTQFQLEGLELSVNAASTPRTAGAAYLLKNNVEPVEAPAGQTNWRLREESRNGDLSIFSHFLFPVLFATKADMERWSEERGFRHIMAQTWFCQRPIRGKPCGLCSPCQYLIRDGLSRRLPPIARIRSFFLPISRPLQRVQDKISRLRAAAS
jgi:hypothetical protein